MLSQPLAILPQLRYVTLAEKAKHPMVSKHNMTKRAKSAQAHPPIHFKHRCIGIVIKHNQPEASALAMELAQFVLMQGFSVAFADESNRAAQEVKAVLKRGQRK